MDIYSQLDHLLANQDPRFPSASSYLAHLGIPSTSIAILENNKITSHIITALADNTQTRFQACSISKPIGAAMSAFRLVDNGKLDLHTPISKYLSSEDLDLISSAATREMVGTITLKQLLSHTSGLETSSALGFPGYDLKHTPRVPNIREVLAGVSPPVNTLQIEPRAFPGQRYCYSGGGTTVVQLIIEQVTGKSYSQAVQELVLDPLNMADSTYHWPADEEINGLERANTRGSGNFARAYYTSATPCEEPQRVNPEMGAAGLWTTPSDMLKAIGGMQASLSGADDAFVSRGLAEEVLTVVQKPFSTGWMRGEDCFGHSGSNMPGWRCVVVGSSAVSTDDNRDDDFQSLPHGCGIAVMTNSVQGVLGFQKVLAAICYLKGWKALPAAVQGSVALPLAIPGEKISDIWRDWEGKYEGGWTLEDKDGKPMASLNGSSGMELVPAAQPRSDALLLRVRSLEVGMELIEKEDRKTLDVWHGPSGKHQLVMRV